MRIVSIARSLPYPGIPHAGGEFYRRHAELLAASHDLTVVCPWSEGNEQALAGSGAAGHRRLLVRRPTGVPLPGRRRAAAAFGKAFPFLASGSFRRALAADPHALAELQGADRVELQWFNQVVMAPRLRRLLPGTPLIGVFHDVVSQGHLRRLRAEHVPPPARLLSVVRFVLSVALERRAMRALDTAVVLSEKDADLLRRRGGRARIVVVAPPLDHDGMPPTVADRRPAGAEVLFVGALWRSENEDAARWLLEDIWPRVRALVPGARLTVAGAGAGAALRRAADGHPDVEVTGYLESLDPCYRRAAVVVAPLRLGAGVKLKSVVAMLWGVPVVATPVAAEGIDGPDVFAAVTDDADSFAHAVARLLRDPGSGAAVARRAHEWAHRTWSAAAYRRALEEVYA